MTAIIRKCVSFSVVINFLKYYLPLSPRDITQCSLIMQTYKETNSIVKENFINLALLPK